MAKGVIDFGPLGRVTWEANGSEFVRLVDGHDNSTDPARIVAGIVDLLRKKSGGIVRKAIVTSTSSY